MKPEIDTVLVINEVGQKVPMKLLTPLYTADQIRQAKVEVLRKALQKIEGLTYKEECEVVIRMMLTD